MMTNEIKMIYCPRCNEEWIQDENEFYCSKCIPCVEIDLAFVELSNAIDTLSKCDLKATLARKSLIIAEYEKLGKFVDKLRKEHLNLMMNKS